MQFCVHGVLCSFVIMACCAVLEGLEVKLTKLELTATGHKDLYSSGHKKCSLLTQLPFKGTGDLYAQSIWAHCTGSTHSCM